MLVRWMSPILAPFAPPGSPGNSARGSAAAAVHNFRFYVHFLLSMTIMLPTLNDFDATKYNFPFQFRYSE